MTRKERCPAMMEYRFEKEPTDQTQCRKAKGHRGEHTAIGVSWPVSRGSAPR
jgi:hypothetical protein